MKPGLRIFFAILGGILAGSVINMLIISKGGELIAPPQGVNPEDINSIKTNINLYESKHYVIPFLAHSLGTLVASFAAVKLAIRREQTVSIIIGIWFLIGGITAASMIRTPLLPTMVDLIFAYFPFAWFGLKLAN